MLFRFHVLSLTQISNVDRQTRFKPHQVPLIIDCSVLLQRHFVSPYISNKCMLFWGNISGAPRAREARAWAESHS